MKLEQMDYLTRNLQTQWNVQCHQVVVAAVDMAMAANDQTKGHTRVQEGCAGQTNAVPLFRFTNPREIHQDNAPDLII